MTEIELEKLSDLEVYSLTIANLLSMCDEHEVQGVFDDGEMGCKGFSVTRVDTSVPGTLVVYNGDRPIFTVHIIEVK